MTGAVRGTRGRPSKPEEARLTVNVQTKVTPAEADELYRLATRRRQDLSELIRRELRRLLRAAPQRRTAPMTAKDTKAQIQRTTARLRELEQYLDVIASTRSGIIGELANDRLDRIRAAQLRQALQMLDEGVRQHEGYPAVLTDVVRAAPRFAAGGNGRLAAEAELADLRERHAHLERQLPSASQIAAARMEAEALRVTAEHEIGRARTAWLAFFKALVAAEAAARDVPTTMAAAATAHEAVATLVEQFDLDVVVPKGAAPELSRRQHAMAIVHALRDVAASQRLGRHVDNALQEHATAPARTRASSGDGDVRAAAR